MATSPSSGDSDLDAAIIQWFQWDKNDSTRHEIEELMSSGEWSKLRSCMLHRLRFGTAGLRGRMAAGVGCMNDVVVLQTAQGLLSYLKCVCTSSQLQSGIVIGFDGRYNSKRFAELTARVFISGGVPARLFSDTVPTPFVSFATLRYGAAAGVMVTASHNPKEDNGYKVYWGNGSQIIAPHDDNILKEIENNLDIADEHWDVSSVHGHALVSDPLPDVMRAYCERVASVLGERVRAQNERSEPVVYSAMHGVGYQAVSNAFGAANLKEPICVMEQRDADPDFPTVRFPNPEESECLALGRQLAEREGVRLLLANDPDADRLAAAEWDDETGTWKMFTGNEMGALLGWWVLRAHSSRADFTPADSYLIASVVSSKMLRSVSRAAGCQYVETLTGFKWMGNKTHLLMQAGKRPVFAFEEAIGYMCDAAVPDKDGVSAAVQVASLATELYQNGSSLRQQLQCLYAEHGYHVSHNFYYVCRDPPTICAIFARLRNYDGSGTYPKRAAGVEIVSVHDLAAGVKVPSDVRNGCIDGDDITGTGLDLPYTGGEMIMLRCANGLELCIRTSGTEPKIKVYTEMVTFPQSEAEQAQEKAKLAALVDALMEDLVQPKKHGLVP